MCDEGWVGVITDGDSYDCSYWQGACHPNCTANCYGPLSSDCVLCHDGNAPAGDDCECMPGYFGNRCANYGGECAAGCLACLDHTYESCILLDENVEYDSMDESSVVCVDGYEELTVGLCEYWGACHVTCDHETYTDGPNGCTGPQASDCIKCSAGAFRNLHGECTCLPGWRLAPNDTGDGCIYFAGPCPANCDYCEDDGNCHGCTTNAGKYTETGTGLGRCECDAGWTGHECQVYNGDCDDSCKTCTGPTY